MKQPRILLALFIFCSTITFAQKAPAVKEEMVDYGKIQANSLVIVIPEASVASIQSEWKSVLKVYGGKPKSSKGMIRAENVVINTMGEGKLNIISKIVPVADGTQLSVAFSNNDKFISSSNNSIPYAAAENLLYNFALRMAKKGVEVKKTDAQKELKTIEKQQKNLEKRLAHLEANIRNWEENIKTAKKEIEATKNELENLIKTIKLKEEQLERIKDRQSEMGNVD